MKKEHTLKSMILVLGIFLTTTIFAQTTHTITLTCDTTNITRDNVNQVCSFGQQANVSNVDFTTYVNVGDVVVWEGQASNAESSVELHSINYQGGQNVFDQNVINDVDGIVTGTVAQGQPGDVEKYSLKFRVYRNGSQLPGIFEIDPRIRIQEF
ncbi:hypothetical protein [Psychroflexus sediminis]|uniref:Uncharacterized protein n=1 Tax=Psychroflexus sediminis TaxID=470826 RepID=A0A1G7VYQ0_9FLAO|nr:hypothetical protein [Psychroflexus sediminis]SDG64791.1 hypothetical protein SAMN04488027_104258 [Psychroflexus sediminis]